MTKFRHLVSLNIDIISENEFLTKEEKLEAFKKELGKLNLENISEQTEEVDTEEIP